MNYCAGREKLATLKSRPYFTKIQKIEDAVFLNNILIQSGKMISHNENSLPVILRQFSEQSLIFSMR